MTSLSRSREVLASRLMLVLTRSREMLLHEEEEEEDNGRCGTQGGINALDISFDRYITQAEYHDEFDAHPGDASFEDIAMQDGNGSCVTQGEINAVCIPWLYRGGRVLRCH